MASGEGDEMSGTWPGAGDVPRRGRRGFCRCATHRLLAAAVHGDDSSAWRRFLLRGDNLAAAVEHLDATYRAGASTNAAYAAARALVEAASRHGDSGTVSVLRSYLGCRANMPEGVLGRVDRAIEAGHEAALAAIALATGLLRVAEAGVTAAIPEWVAEHWYGEALDGRITPSEAGQVPTRIAHAVERLESHAGRRDPAQFVVVADIYHWYAPVFTAPSIPDAVDIVIQLELSSLRLDANVIGPFLRRLPRDEIQRRFAALGEWMGKTYIYDLVITHVLAEFLSRPGDFAAALGELDRLNERTRSGRFALDNPVQRDLEFRTFAHTYARLHGTTRRLPYVHEPPEEVYRRFTELPELQHGPEEEWHLDGRHVEEARRVAYEAAGLLKFLRRFRAGTTRPVVVVGNNRYGRQWIVEPLESLLPDGFSVRYDGAPSHMSMKLTVPSARNFEWSADNTGPWTSDVFPMEFVRRMAREMPHVIVADARSTGAYRGLTMLSRAAKSYAHWFTAFNDVRTGGDLSAYLDDMGLPPEHMEELRRWYEFVRLRRQLAEWVPPGPTYRIGLWAPEMTERAQLGEVLVEGRAPQLDTDRPQVVLANPMIYRTDGHGLPEALRGTTPYYFDGPERYVQEDLVFGFGPYGFQPAVRGTMTATFVAAVQREITAGVERLLAG